MCLKSITRKPIINKIYSIKHYSENFMTVATVGNPSHKKILKYFHLDIDSPDGKNAGRAIYFYYLNHLLICSFIGHPASFLFSVAKANLFSPFTHL